MSEKSEKVGKVWEIVMAYKMHVGEDEGKTQALFDKLVDGCYLRSITVTSDGYMEMDARTMHGGMSEKELERLCVKYFHATGRSRLKLQIDEYNVSFHCKKRIKVPWQEIFENFLEILKFEISIFGAKPKK